MLRAKLTQGQRVDEIREGDQFPVGAGFWNQIIRAVNSWTNLRVAFAEGITAPSLKISDTNAILLLPPAQPGGSGGQFLFRLKSVAANHLVCRTWDGTTEGTADVLVAKSFLLRNSIVSRTIDALTISYTYATTTEREADDGSNTETQVVVPHFVVNDLIYASFATTLVTVADVPLTLMDNNRDGRAWARQYNP